MRSTQQFSVTLPNEMAADVRAKVASGEYASESEVIRDGLRALQARDKAVEHWLRNEIVPAYTALKGDPSRGTALEGVRGALTDRHAARTGQTPAS
jgi:antitoxin ParD1/3/4